MSIIVGNVLNKGLSLVILSCLAAYLGPEGFGRYSFVVAYVAFIGIFTDFGINTSVTRDISGMDAGHAEAFGGAVVARLILCAVSMAASVVVLSALGYRSEVVALAAVASLSLLFSFRGLFFRNVFEVPYLARLAMETPAMINVANELLVLGVILVVIAANGSLFELLLAINLAYIPGFVVIALLSTRLIRPTVRVSFASMLTLLRRSSPIGLSVLLEGLFVIAPIFLLSRMSTETALGLYSLSFRLVASLWIVPVAIMVTFLPGMSRSHASTGELPVDAARRGVTLVLASGVPIAVAAAAFSARIVVLVAGSGFTDAAGALTIMACGTLFYFVNSVFFYSFAASGHQRLSVVSWLTVVVLSVALCAVLIPEYAHLGAAAAYTVSLGAGTIVNLCLWRRADGAATAKPRRRAAAGARGNVNC